MKRNNALIKVVCWLDHPTQLDSPLFRYLTADPRLDFQAVYCVPPGRELLPVDNEIGWKPCWGPDLLNGYSYAIIRDTLLDGARSVSHYAKGYKRFLGIVQGTKGRAFQGVMLGARISGCKLMLRYDATLRYVTETTFWRQRFKWFGLPLLFSQLAYLSYTGKWAREYLEHYGAAKRQLFWLPYTVDHDLLARRAGEAHRPQELRRAFGIKKETLIFLVVAKFTQREAPQDVIRAFHLLNESNTALVIVGDGPQRDDIMAAIRANTQEAIHLAGYVPYKHLPIYYAMADVFIHPAHRECWGVSVNEAMVCGLPVLAADTVGAAADLVEEGVNGYSYPCGDIEVLHELMRRCLTHRTNLYAMGRRSQSKIAGWGAKETAERLADWAMHRI
jgi:glycosyltransferase involved in cell wall biosynthesis